MDWKIIIAEIQEYGHLTQPQIAAACGCSQGTVSDLVNARTAQPRHSLGEALLALRDRVKAEAQNVGA